ncbi:type II secretion system protein [Hyphobacterium sp.]|uniref:type II secretion system protein n=1 Tax=Hyphobacterium sp. TaxID=2004662 RepID=UPI003749C53F
MSAANCQQRDTRSGVTLIEVLVALMLLSIAIAGASPVVSSSLIRMENAKNESLARRLLNELLIAGEAGEGRIDAAEGLVGEWRVVRQVLDSGRVASAPVRLEEVRVEIQWQRGNRTRLLSARRQIIVPDSR